jgi:hypothetical protein
MLDNLTFTSISFLTNQINTFREFWSTSSTQINVLRFYDRKILSRDQAGNTAAVVFPYMD